MTISSRLLCAALALCASAATAAPKVVVDIAPVRALVGGVMGDLDAPTLLLPPGASPHGYAMRPSSAAALDEADLVFWIGPALTPWMEKSIVSLASRATVVRLAEVEGLHLAEIREDHDDHDGHGYAGEHGDGHRDDHADDHSHDGKHDHKHGHADKHADRVSADDENGRGHAHHSEGGLDPHIWLDPKNGAAMLPAIVEALSGADPEGAETYRANAAALAERLKASVDQAEARLGATEVRRYFSAHDAYRYFEARFGLEFAGSLASGDAESPSAASVSAFRDGLTEGGRACVLTDTTAGRAAASAFEEAEVVFVDPLGGDLSDGVYAYDEFIAYLAERIGGCLDGA